MKDIQAICDAVLHAGGSALGEVTNLGTARRSPVSASTCATRRAISSNLNRVSQMGVRGNKSPRQSHPLPAAAALFRPLVFQIAALDRDLVGDVLRIMPDTPEEGGAAPRLPGEPEKVDTGFRGERRADAGACRLRRRHRPAAS